MSIELIAKSEAPRVDWLAGADLLAGDIARHAAEHDAQESFVSDTFANLKAQGLFKALVPAELGGGGASVADVSRIIRRVGASCGSSALAFSMHSHLVATAAWRWRHQNAPTDGLLKRVAAEDLVLVSSGGSDWLRSEGTARKHGDGFLVNARKVFSSGCPAGNLLMTSAVYDDPEAGPTVLHFAVPFSAPGVSVLDTWHVLGMRGTGSHDVLLRDVFVPAAAISGRRPQGKWHMLFHIISMIAFPLVYSAYVGVAEGARAKALEIARSRAGDAVLAARVGAMETALATAGLALDDMVRTAESAAPGPETTSRVMIGRTLAGRAAIETVEHAMEVVGGASFYRDLGLERAFRDVQGARFHPLRDQEQAAFSGRVALGMDIDA